MQSIYDMMGITQVEFFRVWVTLLFIAGLGVATAYGLRWVVQAYWRWANNRTHAKWAYDREELGFITRCDAETGTVRPTPTEFTQINMTLKRIQAATVQDDPISASVLIRVYALLAASRGDDERAKLRKCVGECVALLPVGVADDDEQFRFHTQHADYCASNLEHVTCPVGCSNNAGAVAEAVVAVLTTLELRTRILLGDEDDPNVREAARLRAHAAVCGVVNKYFTLTFGETDDCRDACLRAVCSQPDSAGAVPDQAGRAEDAQGQRPDDARPDEGG